MQAGADAAVDARAGPGLHQLQRFVDVKAQQALIDDDALAVGHQIIQIGPPVGPRGNHRVQILGRLAQEIVQGFTQPTMA